jgi:hypothetical protein
MDCQPYHLTYRLDGHPRAVEREGKQDILALMTFKLRSKHRLGERERMADMQMAVRVRIGKGDHERFSVGIQIRLEGLAFLPLFLDGNFVGSQGIALAVALGRRGDPKILHFLRGGGHGFDNVKPCISGRH